MHLLWFYKYQPTASSGFQNSGSERWDLGEQKREQIFKPENGKLMDLQPVLEGRALTAAGEVWVNQWAQDPSEGSFLWGPAPLLDARQGAWSGVMAT